MAWYMRHFAERSEWASLSKRGNIMHSPNVEGWNWLSPSQFHRNCTQVFMPVSMHLPIEQCCHSNKDFLKRTQRETHKSGLSSDKKPSNRQQGKV